MKHSLFFRNLSLVAILGILVFSSCVSQKKVLLLKDIQMAEENKSIEYQNERSLNYKIQPGDNLYIKAINIFDEKNSSVLNGEEMFFYTYKYMHKHKSTKTYKMFAL